MGYVNKDRFGNDYIVIGCYDKKEKGYAVGYVEIGNKLYKVEPSEAKSDKQNKRGEDLLMWVKLTHVPKQSSKKRGL